MRRHHSRQNQSSLHHPFATCGGGLAHMVRDYGINIDSEQWVESAGMSAYQSRNRRNGITSRFRLRGFDYSLPGFYFVTVCIQNRASLFGDVANDVFVPSQAGTMVQELWLEQEARFPGIELDAHCVMPNHFHALIGLGTHDDVISTPVTLPQIMQGFKAATTVAYGRGVGAMGWLAYEGKLWQTGYHEHIVRDDLDLDRIRDYIEGNPASWSQDGFYTAP